METEIQQRPGTSAAGPLQERANKLADTLKKLTDIILTQSQRTTPELKGAVTVVVAELRRTADAIKESGEALMALREEAKLQRHLGLLDARDRLALLEDVTKSALAGAASSATFIGDTARVKLALARMDTADLYREQRRTLAAEQRRLEETGEEALRDIGKRIDALVTAFAVRD